MNRNDQKSIGNLYTEAILQGASGKKHDTELMGLRKILELRPDSAIAQIAAKLNNADGMPYNEFRELAIQAFREAGITTGAGLSNNRLFEAIEKVLEVELGLSEIGDAQQRVFIVRQ